MKKLLIFLLLVLGTYGVVSGQKKSKPAKYPPILEYNENGYKTSDLSDFIFGTTPLSASYRVELLRLINQALEDSGESANINDGKPLDDHWFNWIIAHTSKARRKLSSFRNSRNVHENVEFYDDEDFDGSVFYFHFRSCGVPYAKLICINLLEVPFERISFNEERKPDVPPEQFTEQRVPTMGIPTFTETTTKDSTVIKKGISTLGWVGIGVGTGVVAILVYEATHKSSGPGGTTANNNGGNNNSGGPGGTPANQGGNMIPPSAMPHIGNFGFSAGFMNQKVFHQNGQITNRKFFGISASFRF